MTLSVNPPFSPYKPVERSDEFFDRKDAEEKILLYLDKRGASGASASCSVIGGIGMGKTSILKYLRLKFSQQVDIVPDTEYRYIPIYFEYPQDDTLANFFQQLSCATISRTMEWLIKYVNDVPNEPIQNLQVLEKNLSRPNPSERFSSSFETVLWTVIEAIDDANLTNVKLLFLLDDVYWIEKKDVREILIKYWRELFNEGNRSKEVLRSHLAVVMTFRNYHDQFLKNCLLPTFAPVFLYVFEKKDAIKVITMPFKDAPEIELKDEAVEKVYNLAGGHPFFLKDMVFDLWIDARESGVIDLECIERHIEDWSLRHPQIYKEIEKIASNDEHKALAPVFEWLGREGGQWSLNELGKALNLPPGRIRDALKTLQSWGIVREISDKDPLARDQKYYKLSGELFQEWFSPLKKKSTEAPISEDDIKELIIRYNRRLQILKEQQAIYGIATPPHILIEIEDIEAKINKDLQATFRGFKKEASGIATQRPVKQKTTIFRLFPVIDWVAAGKEKLVSDDIIGFIHTDELKVNGQILTVESLRENRVTFYPEYNYFAVQFSEDSLYEVDISPSDYVILQKPKLMGELSPNSGDIVAVLSRDESSNRLLLRHLDVGSRGVNILGEVKGIAVAVLKLQNQTEFGKVPQHRLSKQQEAVSVRVLPIIDENSARKERPAANDIIDYIYANKFEVEEQILQVEPFKRSQVTFHPEYDYCTVRVSGDSMEQAGISSDDYVILQRKGVVSLHPISGDIVAVVFQDEDDNRATLKRIFIEKSNSVPSCVKKVILKPANPNYQERILLPKDFSLLKVVGVAIAVLKPIS